MASDHNTRVSSARNNNNHNNSSVYRTRHSSTTSTGSQYAPRTMKKVLESKKGSACLRHLKENSLVLSTLLGVLVGFLIGYGVKQSDPTDDAIMWLGLPGEIFMRCLTSMVLPLIISNVIAGSSSLDVKSNGKLGILAVIYVIVTNIIAATIGGLLSLAIRPGSGVTDGEQSNIETKKIMKTPDLFADLIRNMFPENLITSTFRQTQTRYHNVTRLNSTHFERYLTDQNGTNVLGMITMGFIFGMAASAIKEQGKPFRMFFESTSVVVTKVLHYLFLITPVGVASLIASSVARIPNLSSLFTSLGKFTATVTVGLFLYMFILLPVFYVIVFRRNPFRFLATCIRPCIIGFTFTSGSVALPEIEHTLVKKNNVDKRVSHAILPLIVTLNADGSSMFIVAAAMFVAQHANMALNIGNMVALIFLTAISTLALPGTPSSSIVALVLLLTSMNIPTQGVAMLYAIEWFLDRIRTSGNVLSHIVGAMFVIHLCKSDIPPETDEFHNDRDNDQGDEEMSELTATTGFANTPASDDDDDAGHNPKINKKHQHIELNGHLLKRADNPV